ncbi:MAG TPA: hypothetical protein DD490_26075 [Acidobacteria bacterium]|nr:hypothetical protein [Acidobacteriota bacterium]
MREITKSIASFSWAMSLFGARQLANLMRPSEAAESFDAVTRATEHHLGETLRSAFQMGDRLQRGMVDIAFSMMGTTGLQADRWAGAAADAAGKAAAATATGLRGAAWSAEPETGWGPMPQRGAGNPASPVAPGPAVGQTKATSDEGWGPVPAERA